jgi:hypothetical protein
MLTGSGAMSGVGNDASTMTSDDLQAARDAPTTTPNNQRRGRRTGSVDDIGRLLCP